MGKVLLTGGNGFIAAHILAKLLLLNYSVVTTVRSPAKAEPIAAKYPDAVKSGQIKFAIVEDITRKGAFDEVLKSEQFDGIMHTSSPFVYDVEDVIKDLLEPAIHGTIEILRAAKAFAPTVKRVVITSSFASVIDPKAGDRPGYKYSEKDWNPVTYEDAQKNPVVGYYGSKTLAEQVAWDFIEKEKPTFSISTICPPRVLGPIEHDVQSLSKLNTSIADIYTIFSGQAKELKPIGVWIWVDVRDVADAHVAALENAAAANQRFLVSEGRFSVQQIADYIWKHYPERALIKGIPKGTPGQYFPESGTYSPDNSRSKEILGLKYRTFDEMLKDQLASFESLEKEGK